MTLKFLKEDGLEKFVDALNKGDKRVVGPKKNNAGMVLYEDVESASELELDEVIGRYSPKDAFFPQHETILRYKLEGNNVHVEPEKPIIRDTVLIGVRPCDAAAVISLNKVFTWDYIDTLFTERQKKIAVIAFACNKADDSCFCTSVGYAPDGTEGSDILLKKLKNGGYQATVLTERGEGLVSEYKALFADGDGGEIEPIAKPDELDIDLDKMKKWLDDPANFEHPIWEQMAAKCVGCGGCTFVCPTCHCFDIVDEPHGDQGRRVKNWDGCQFDHFTLHASGHNPRENQPQRWRNRFSCKFKIYPDRFEKKGCVGCGRCIRVCPVNVDITEAMTEISQMPV
jgi:ferredoxin